METSDNPSDNNYIKNLREGIQNKYTQYHQTDRDRFPDFEYNTNRANYIPLRASFEEEFFVTQGLDRATKTIRIPSVSTLAQLFTDDGYMPNKKLLETCLLYAKRPLVISGSQLGSAPEHLEKGPVKKPVKLFAGGFALLLCVGILFVAGRRFFVSVPSGLIINRPTANSTVQQELVVQGSVANAKTVWLAVHYKKGFQYWIQPSVNVQADGSWFGVVYVGEVSSEYAGLPFEIRAFINPTKELKNGQIHHAWPDAELSSEVVEVIRR
jgi:hypothetical protein